MSKDSKAKKTKKHYKSLEKKTALWGLIFLLPWLIGLIFFFLRPLFLTFYSRLIDIRKIGSICKAKIGATMEHV